MTDPTQTPPAESPAAAPDDSDARGPGAISRWAWLPIPLLLAGMALLWTMGVESSYESPFLLMALNLVFTLLTCLFVAYLFARSFLARGSLGLLLVGCGVLAWAVSGVVGVIAGLAVNPGHNFPNTLVTTHNLCLLLSAICQLVGAALLMAPGRTTRTPGLALAGAVTATLGVMGLVTLGVLAGAIPEFFIPGQGGTPLRQRVVASTAVMFLLTAGLLAIRPGGQKTSAFRTWYALALVLMACGLLGILLQRSTGSPLGWAGQGAQYLGGLYALMAGLISVRETRVWGVPLAEALRRSEARYHRLFEGMTEGFALHEVLCDEAGRPVDYRFLEVNPAFERLTGLTRANVIARTCKEILPGENPRWLAEYGRVALTGEPVHFEDYSPVLGRHFEVYAYCPARGQFAVIFSDITDRKRAQEALQHSAQRRELLADTVSGLLQAEVPQEVVERLCRKVMEFLDCQVFFNFLVAPAAGKLHLNACAGIPGDAARLIEWLEYGVAVCGCAARDGCRIVATDIQNGSDPRTELVKGFGIRAYACHPLVSENRVIGTLSFGTRTRDRFSDEDLSLMKAVADHVAIATARKQAETALRLTADELARSNHDLEQFAYVASHDLKEPLRMVTGFLDLLQKAFPETLNEKARQYVAHAMEGGMRMQQLVDDLLAYSRVGRGCQIEAVDLQAVFDQVRGSLQFRIADAGAVLTADPLPTVRANAMEMTQVFQNLLGNALKFRSDKSPAIHVGAAASNGHWAIWVRDNGIGIDPRYFERIFQIFQQLHTREQYPGTGIGLAICKKIIERHGGRIWVESAEGSGSTFHFALPAAHAAPAKDRG